MLHTPQQNPLKYGFSGIEILTYNIASVVYVNHYCETQVEASSLQIAK